MAKVHRNSLKPGYELHWYEIIEILGQGGFGITYLARDKNLNLKVAIKEYLPIELAVREADSSIHPVSDDKSEGFEWGLEKFIAEARTLAQFKHPNIVRVNAVFEANNTAYMVMEYEEGYSLGERLKSHGTLEESELMKVLIPILGGLEAVHAAGFIHRDIKPDNIFIRSDGSPVLLDFGSARQALGAHTRTLTSVASVGYAPFEQYAPNSARQGPWTDIYGLGATLYRAISGRAPLDAIDRGNAIVQTNSDVFVSASEVGAGRYSQRFLAAINAALHFKAGDRPQSIREWRAMFAARSAIPDLPYEATSQEQGGNNHETHPAAVVDVGGDTVRAEAVQEPRTKTPATWTFMHIATLVLLWLVAAGTVFWLWPRSEMQVTDTAKPPEPGAQTLRVAQLLAEAHGHLKAGRLIGDDDDNALSRFQAVLRLDADNAVAARGVTAVATALIVAAIQRVEVSDLVGARRILETVIPIAPEHPQLAEVRRLITNAQRKETETPPSLALLEKMPCSKEKGLRSTDSSVTTAIRFENQSQQAVLVFWLDHLGRRVQYAELAPHQSYRQETYVSHPWVITDAGGTCRAVYLPARTPARVAIDDQAVPATAPDAAGTTGFDDEANNAFATRLPTPGQLVLCRTGSDAPPPDVCARVAARYEMEVSVDINTCGLERLCGHLAGYDCRAATDGPYNYFDARTGETIASCGGRCMWRTCTDCPPPTWVCPTY